MSTSWRNLDQVYKNTDLSKRLEKLENKYHGREEVEFFEQLVNTSISKKQPYHRWIRYREGYAGDLVKEILRRYPIEESHFVLDPMCGSGSTIVACNELGIGSIGLDVNPYAVLSTEMKSLSFTSDFASRIRSFLKKIELEIDNQENATQLNDFELDLLKYFDRSNLDQLVRIKRNISKTSEKKTEYDFLMFALIAIIEDCSNRKKDGNGLATRQTKISDCYALFSSQVNKMLADYQEAPYPEPPKSKTALLSALDLDSTEFGNVLNKDKVGAIIFSPPYANSFDYFESYKMELIFGEWSKANEIHDKRKSLIRNYRLGYGKELQSNFEIVEDICAELWSRIPEKEAKTGKKDGRTRLVPNMLRAYFEDMSKVIINGMSLLEDGGHMHIVIDQSAYVGAPIPTDTIFAHIADQQGYEVIEILKCRRANTSGQQLKQFPYLKDLLRETIVTIKK